MSHFTLTLGPLGPLLIAFVGVSRERGEALQKAGQKIPEPIRVQGLVDTGASCTAIDRKVLSQLGVSPTGTTQVHTPSTGAAKPHETNQYDVLVMIPGINQQSRAFITPALPVIEADLEHQGYQALIGRDILASCVLTYVGYEGQAGHFTLAF